MKKLILVGGGKAHLQVLEKLQKGPLKNAETLLISPNPFQYYSGMFSGFVEGIYHKDEIRINLERLTKRANIEWLEDAVTAIDPMQKKVLTATGQIFNYDAISFDIGSLTAGTDLQGVKEYAYRIKPNYHFVNTIEKVRKEGKVVIVGGGAMGIEIALALKAWRDKNGIKDPVTLINLGLLLENEADKLSEKIEKITVNKGIQVLTGIKVHKVERNEVWTSSEEKQSYDHLVWLAGPKAPGLFKASHLPVDQEGYLKVEETLQVKAFPSIFGAGECICIDNPVNSRLATTSVNVVKQGNILYENIKGFFDTGIGQLFVPPKNELSFLSLGNKKACFLYNKFTYIGGFAWVLKNKIDKQFVRKYQSL